MFFRKELSQLIDRPVLLPEVYSLEDYLLQFTSLKKIDTIEAIFELYEVYKDIQSGKETLDKFFFWGEMILRDFQEIDQYLVNAKHLFQGIKSQKELDEAFYFLDEEEKAIIQSFWNTFLPESTESQKLFLETWKVLLPLYEGYKKQLRVKGLGYGGMIYRDIADRLEERNIKCTGKIYFAGFNALTKSEETIIKYFIREFKAEVVWDIDEYYFANSQQEAGTFFRKYSKDTLLGKSFPSEVPSRINKQKTITATGVSLEVGQAKAMGEHLAKAAQHDDFDPARTVVVLPQEHMMFPALHAIPEEISKVNITMGYPLRATSVYSLLENALDLQRHKRESESSGVSFYYKPVQQVLLHPLIFPIEEESITVLTSSIKKRNQITIHRKELTFKSEVLRLLFIEDQAPLDYIIKLLNRLCDYWKDQNHDLELEFISRFYDYALQLKNVIGDRADELAYDFFSSLFKKLSRSLKVPFSGEPLDGLQIMGILETRNLDFDRVFVLNMNEGSWPASPRKGSFIPFNIRKAFGLPVYENNDAIYAYLFYRLIQRADEVHFYHNMVSEFNINGELSRLVKQLEVESNHEIHKSILANPIKTKPVKPILVEKKIGVLRQLDRFLAGYNGDDASKLTASAINTYLDCRLRFYFKYVAKFYEPDDVQEELDPMVFGNILHNCMELLYKDFQDREKRNAVNANDIILIRQGIVGALKKVFKKHYNIKEEGKLNLEGPSLLAFEILQKFAHRILDHDEQYAPFKIVGLESGSDDGFYHELPIKLNQKEIAIRIHGIIDRLDQKDGKIRVIDYKTGKDKKVYSSLDSLTNRDDKNRNKAIFQVFFYSFLYWKNFNTDLIIEPGIFNSKDLFDKDFNHQIIHKEGRNTSPIIDFRSLAMDYEQLLTDILAEIFDPKVPFDQTEDEKKCEYCPYKEICSR